QSMTCMMNCEKSPYSNPRTPSDPYAWTIASRTTPFQPAPYCPVAKIPTDRTPQRPLTPCTEMAPTGSSTPRASKKKTLTTTSQPATAPITAAAHGSTNAHGAVMATRPASMPLHIIVGSGLSPFNISTTIAPSAPVIDIDGDGSLNMTIHELATCRRYGVGVKVVVINNQWLGMVRQWQGMIYDGPRAGAGMGGPKGGLAPGGEGGDIAVSADTRGQRGA